jgi:membrane protein DedA with SNARE-associated domain
MGLFDELITLFSHYGYWAVFVGVMLENAGLPLPGEAILLAAAFFAYQGHFQIAVVIAVAFLGAVLGDNMGYWLGHRGGRPLLERYGRFLRLGPAQLAALEAFFARHGSRAVFLARFVTGLRVVTALFAGAARMPWPRFLSYNVAGALTWSMAVGGLGYLFGYSWEALAHWLGRGSLLAMGAVGIVALGLWVRRRLPSWRWTLAGQPLASWLRREAMLLFLILLSLGLFSKIVEDVVAAESKSFDLWVLQTIHRWLPPSWEPGMEAITKLGSLTVLGGLVAVVAVVLILRRRRRPARLIVASGLLTLLFDVGLKRLFARPRPELWGRPPDDSFSFPSGHTFASVVIYGVFAYLLAQAYPRWRMVLWGFYVGLVGLIGLSRIYLGQHWPTDVLGGWTAGALLLSLILYGYERRYRALAPLWNALRRRRTHPQSRD